MIDGEIYTFVHNTDLVFAYKETMGDYYIHYIMVNAFGEVKRNGDGRCNGKLLCNPVRLATIREKERFKRLLHMKDYHYSVANKKVRRISTGEILL